MDIKQRPVITGQFFKVMMSGFHQKLVSLTSFSQFLYMLRFILFCFSVLSLLLAFVFWFWVRTESTTSCEQGSREIQIRNSNSRKLFRKMENGVVKKLRKWPHLLRARLAWVRPPPRHGQRRVHCVRAHCPTSALQCLCVRFQWVWKGVRRRDEEGEITRTH